MTTFHLENENTFSGVYPDLDFKVFEKEKETEQTNNNRTADSGSIPKIEIFPSQEASQGHHYDPIPPNSNDDNDSDNENNVHFEIQNIDISSPPPTHYQPQTQFHPDQDPEAQSQSKYLTEDGSKCIICFKNICESRSMSKTNISTETETEMEVPIQRNVNVKCEPRNVFSNGNQESIFHDFSKMFRISTTIYQDIDLRALASPLFCLSCSRKVLESIEILRQIEKLEENLNRLQKEIREDLLESYRCFPEGFAGQRSSGDANDIDSARERKYRIPESSTSTLQLSAKSPSREKDQIRKAFAQCWLNSQVSLRNSPAVRLATKRRRLARRTVVKKVEKMEQKVEEADEEILDGDNSDSGSLYEPTALDYINSDVEIDVDSQTGFGEAEPSDSVDVNGDDGNGTEVKASRKKRVKVDPDLNIDDLINGGEEDDEIDKEPRKKKAKAKKSQGQDQGLKRNKLKSGLKRKKSGTKADFVKPKKRKPKTDYGTIGNKIGNPLVSFQCDFCKRAFNKDDYKAENGEYIITCDLPNCKTTKPFTSLAIFKKHHQLNCLSKPDYTCEHCSRRCFSSKTLKLHIIARHPVNKKGVPLPIRPTTFKCDYCERVFNRDEYKTESGKFVYTCELPNCKTSNPFKTFSIFKKHHKKNCLLRPSFPCEYCGRNCFSPKSLEEHIISQHTKQYEFTCEICGYAGLNATYLNRHMKFSHSDERPFKCEICAEAFKDKRMYICHMRRHNNEMPYVCEICGKGFPGSQGFYKHKFVHQTEKKYNCPICSKPFKSPHYVATHVWNAHKKGRSGKNKAEKSANAMSQSQSHSFVPSSTNVDSVDDDDESMEFESFGFN